MTQTMVREIVAATPDEHVQPDMVAAHGAVKHYDTGTVQVEALRGVD